MTTTRSRSSESRPSAPSRSSQAPGERKVGRGSKPSAAPPTTTLAPPSSLGLDRSWMLPSQATLDHVVSSSARPIEPPKLRNPPWIMRTRDRKGLVCFDLRVRACVLACSFACGAVVVHDDRLHTLRAMQKMASARYADCRIDPPPPTRTSAVRLHEH